MGGYSVIDLHEDLSYYYVLEGAGHYRMAPLEEESPGREVDVPRYERANIRILFAAIFPGVGGLRPPKRLPTPVFTAAQDVILEHFKTYYLLSEMYGFEIVEGAGEAEGIVGDARWRLGLLLHLEGADPLSDAYDLRVYYRLGLRSLGLTWNYNNRYAASCMSKKDYGLTDDGYELVREANRLGVIVDLAHASKRTVIEASEASKKPVIISHASLRSFVDTPRNVDYEAVEAVASTGGVLGVTFIPGLVSSRDPTIEDVASIILDLVERYGSQLPAIGSDYFGIPGLRPPRGLESAEGIQRLLSLLAERGLGDRDLERIAYGNALRVIKENLGG